MPCKLHNFFAKFLLLYARRPSPSINLTWLRVPSKLRFTKARPFQYCICPQNAPVPIVVVPLARLAAPTHPGTRLAKVTIMARLLVMETQIDGVNYATGCIGKFCK